jgi:hypothetical protein
MIKDMARPAVQLFTPEDVDGSLGTTLERIPTLRPER